MSEAVDRQPNAACPRCGAAFHCGAQAKGCACEHVELDAATLAALRAGYVGCLCTRCLRELAADAATTHIAPGSESSGA